MFPSVPLPTDNLYKFLCFLGLALSIASIAALTAIYISAFNAKARFGFEIIELDKAPLPKPAGYEDKIKLTQHLLHVTQKNEKTLAFILTFPLALGLALIIFFRSHLVQSRPTTR